MAKKLHSRLFREAATLKKEFFDHLSNVWNLPPPKYTILLQHLPRIIQAVTSQERQVQVQEAVEALDGDAQKAIQAINVLQYFAAQWNPFHDSVEGVLKDVHKLDLFPKELVKKKSAEDFFKKYFEFLEKDSARRRKLEFASRALPCLKAVSCVIDYRVVVESVFDWQKDNPVKYKPSCVATVPVFIVCIKRDEGDPIIFQCEPEDMEMLIREFQATLKEYETSKKLLK